MTVTDVRGSTITVPVRPLTLDDWNRIRSEDTDHRYELVDGNLIVMPPAPSNHAVVVSELLVWLCNRGFSPSQVLADCGLATVAVNGRVPDLMVLYEPVPNMNHLLPPMARLVVEVVSKGSESQDRYVKPREYAQAGLELFWRVEGVADLTTTMVHCYRLTDGEYVRYLLTSLDDLLEFADLTKLGLD